MSRPGTPIEIEMPSVLFVGLLVRRFGHDARADDVIAVTLDLGPSLAHPPLERL
jgi:hypothetical protein